MQCEGQDDEWELPSFSTGSAVSYTHLDVYKRQVLYYRLDANEYSATKKMIIIE